MYTIEHYAADGHAGSPADEYLVATDVPTLAAARAIVRDHLGLRALRASRCWYPPAEMLSGEAYHDFPASHRDADGCGGFHIYEEPVPA